MNRIVYTFEIDIAEYTRRFKIEVVDCLCKRLNDINFY